jgi:hypothetical protein
MTIHKYQSKQQIKSNQIKEKKIKANRYQYRRAASDDLSSSANMKKMKSGKDMPV